MHNILGAIRNAIRNMTADRTALIGTSSDASMQLMRAHAAVR